MRRQLRTALGVLISAAAGTHGLRAQSTTPITIDAVTQPQPPETGFLHLGSARSPDGHTIGATSRYLLRDGKPWLPVMGELHFTRIPESEWANEIEKMKAGGVNIISSYVFWNHHEEIKGEFDWTGRRDLRRFVELCGERGMLAYVRVGPWSHGEARNGGFPDWLLQSVKEGVRSNDSTYLSYVARFYDQIGAQLHGLLWKDGGPVVGVQLENEYTARGPGKGPEHILKLKELALKAGLDAPLYSVTGWDGASFPPAEVIPVFGGYPDAPWDAARGMLPPNEVYAFRFENRVAGNMGTQGFGGKTSETAASALERYPFFGAEYAGGIQVTYHRRPVITPSDIAAMLPVQLGSGVNLYGYYMFHGGANPPGKLTTLQESQRTGYPTDVPVVSYDFQAPLSESGEMRESFRRIKTVHYFLNEFGAALAPMVVRKPNVTPANPADTSVPRLAARTLGDSGYLFFNNHIRNYPMPVRHGVQVTVRLPGETLVVPNMPVDIPADAYFIWPLNLAVGGARLKYSTAQLMTRVVVGGEPVFVFFTVPGIASEFVFDSARVASLTATTGRVTRGGGRIRVAGMRPGLDATIAIRARDGSVSRVLLLTRAQAGNSWRFSTGGADRILITNADVFADSSGIHLRSPGIPHFDVALIPAPTDDRMPGVLRRTARAGMFALYSGDVPRRDIHVSVAKVSDAAVVPPVKTMNAVTWRKDSVALAPIDSAFTQAAKWELRVPAGALRGLTDVVLEIDYTGDVARLRSSNDVLLDDDFFIGRPWRIGLKRFAGKSDGPFTLQVLPLRNDAPIYFQPPRPVAFPPNGQVATLQKVRAVPQYELVIRSGAGDRHGTTSP